MSSGSRTSPRMAPRRVPFPIHDEVQQDHTALPPDHFLSQRPITPPQPDSVIAERYWSARARPDTSSLAAADYDVSVLTGFLPPEEPVQRLEVGKEWELFEGCLDEAQEAVKVLEGGGVGRMDEAWREKIRALPTPSTEVLTTLPLLRRAHVLLSFLSHFYVHSTFPATNRVPAPLAVPWVLVSDKLGIPPVLNYADTVLWNWRLIDSSRGLRADNLDIPTSFTGSSSERAFFLLSLLCELHGPNILRLMSATLDEAFFADEVALGRIASYLDRISSSIDELTVIMREGTKGGFGHQGREKIVPAVFYWEIRPWFNGGKWFYEGVGEDDEDIEAGGKEMEWGGPSAGQSSLVHALDLFLGVDHTPRPTKTAESTSTSAHLPPLPPAALAKVKQSQASVPITDSTFMVRASQYMPSFHRAFLRHLSALHLPSASNPSPIPSLRSLATTYPVQLRDSYDNAINSMKRFRDGHMGLVTVFIVTQAKREPGKDTVFWAGWETKRLEKEAEEARRKAEDGEKVAEKMMGTGGTDLVTFLKACRDRTVEAFLGRA
ncbi:Indoleamine 2,3-dioxygenase [Leucosporidium creatinivorum]|uniref:Indoleamine 2,3-dioxygenase n=1 Tax=Leucosporidium creatinivorum TaxID=106004 RepID=A0A1Y2D603_9BASI|nr:Indoleamine 2,3-dioxygenase [Leucosporidium creatinivorum]